MGNGSRNLGPQTTIDLQSTSEKGPARGNRFSGVLTAPLG